MIKKSKKKVEIEEEVIDDIICNNCGKSCSDSSGLNYEGLLEPIISGGYGSIIGDGTTISFSLCEKCIIEIAKNFVIPMTVVDEFLDIVSDVSANELITRVENKTKKD